jgi:hypothetical protein
MYLRTHARTLDCKPLDRIKHAACLPTSLVSTAIHIPCCSPLLLTYLPTLRHSAPNSTHTTILSTHSPIRPRRVDPNRTEPNRIGLNRTPRAFLTSIHPTSPPAVFLTNHQPPTNPANTESRTYTRTRTRTHCLCRVLHREASTRHIGEERQLPHASSTKEAETHTYPSIHAS